MPLDRWRNLFKRRSTSVSEVVQQEAALLSLKIDAEQPARGLQPQGLQILTEGINPVVDIVAVHGLNGHREKTWTASNGVQWLRDLLSKDIPNARILSWGFDANTQGSLQLNSKFLDEHTEALLSDLCLERQLTKTRSRPIIFIAHSLGGIIVKSALIHSDAAPRSASEWHRSVKLSTYGVLFMGTPHQGCNGVQLGKILANIASVFVEADARALEYLEKSSRSLQQELREYGPISGEFVTKCAFETYSTKMPAGGTVMVVPKEAAVVPGVVDAEPIPIAANHHNLVKFRSKEDEGYQKILAHLKLFAEQASNTIKNRWATEESRDKVQQLVTKPASLSNTQQAHQQTSSSVSYVPFIIASESCPRGGNGHCISTANLESLAAGKWHALQGSSAIGEQFGEQLTQILPSRPNRSYETRWRLFIYCAPCTRLIDLALSICGHIVGFNGILRVDDRLSVPCCRTEDRATRMSMCETLFREMNEDWRVRNNFDRSWLSGHVDVPWLQQRIHELSLGFEAEITSMRPLFQQAEDDQRCSAIVVLAAPESCSELMSNAPVSSMVAKVTNGSIYRLKDERNGSWTATFFGRM
ncbi:hypothetical protein MMC20_002789 [Loxospora ochrophaea]|nr:hypothetical protein [Loxospora ochrophaea]